MNKGLMLACSLVVLASTLKAEQHIVIKNDASNEAATISIDCGKGKPINNIITPGASWSYQAPYANTWFQKMRVNVKSAQTKKMLMTSIELGSCPAGTTRYVNIGAGPAITFNSCQ